MTSRSSRIRGYLCLLSLLALLGGALFGGELFFGSVNIPLRGTLEYLLTGEGLSPQEAVILGELRFPRGCAAWLGGASLGVAGLLMQTWFRNPLGGPFLLGTSSGASLGVALVLLGFPLAGKIPAFGSALLLGASFGGALGALLVILLGSRSIRGNTGILLLGLMLGYLANAGVTVLLAFGSLSGMRSYLSWSFGTFAGVAPSDLPLFALVCASALGISLGLGKSLNALLLGESYAASLGISLGRVRFLVFLATALAAGGVTAFCGPVAFLGVAVPHLCRGLFRSWDHRVLLPACIFGGGALALGADLLTRLGPEGTLLPLNAVTALLGVPVVLWVLFRYRSGEEDL